MGTVRNWRGHSQPKRGQAAAPLQHLVAMWECGPRVVRFQDKSEIQIFETCYHFFPLFLEFKKHFKGQSGYLSLLVTDWERRHNVNKWKWRRTNIEFLLFPKFCSRSITMRWERVQRLDHIQRRDMSCEEWLKELTVFILSGLWGISFHSWSAVY